jgi:hypothetical protein
MSEYQYYEFQAIDRPLTEKQMDELRGYSTRAQITPSSFVNVYHWSNLKGDPEKWMEKYFDAFLYLANWGTRWFMLRVPKRLLNPDTVSTYCNDENLSYRIKGDHLILSFNSEEEEPEWAEGEGWLASLLPLRADLMRGDYRCLYLVWLLSAQWVETDDETPEVPVPPGLGDLNAPLRSLADFLRIDPDLIAAAAERSNEEPATGLLEKDIARWVTSLPAEDKDTILTNLLASDDPHVVAELRQRALREIHGTDKPDSANRKSARRTVGQLVARAEEITQERKKKEAERRAREKVRRERERAEKRKKLLESLVGEEERLWAKVDQLIATRQPKRYDEAVSLLQDIRDLADMKGKAPEFSTRMSTLHGRHMKKPSLMRRFRKANLID